MGCFFSPPPYSSHCESRGFFPVDSAYLQRLIRAHGPDPEEVLAGYGQGAGPSPIRVYRPARISWAIALESSGSSSTRMPARASSPTW